MRLFLIVTTRGTVHNKAVSKDGHSVDGKGLKPNSHGNRNRENIPIAGEICQVNMDVPIALARMAGALLLPLPLISLRTAAVPGRQCSAIVL